MNLDDRNKELEAKLEHNPVDEQIAILVRADRRRKWQLIALTILAIGLVIISARTFQLARLAQSNRQAVIASCEVSNEARANNRQLWDHLFSLSPQEPQTPEQMKRIDDFKQFVKMTFAPRDCQAEINK